MYTKGNVVLLRCSHIREVRGEGDEVIRRTRSDEAESAVIGAVRESGVEPAWFFERWREALICPVIYERIEDAARFKEVALKHASEDMAVVDDDGYAEEVAGYLNAEWKRLHDKQMGKYRAVLEDAKGRGFAGRCAVGEWRGDEGKWKDWMGEQMAKWPNGSDGKGGIAYTAYKGEDGVIRFAICVPDGEYPCGGDAVMKSIDGELTDEEVEMSALVIAKMRKDEVEGAAGTAEGAGN